MKFRLLFTPTAESHLKTLETNPAQKTECKAVKKALAYMEIDIRHKSLQTHKYESIKGPNGEEIFEAYAQQNTPGAYRIFWCYGPSKSEITIISIILHP